MKLAGEFRTFHCVGICKNTLFRHTYGCVDMVHMDMTWSWQWRHNGRDGLSNHQPRDCLLNRLSRRRSKIISKLHVTGLCAGNSPVTGEFPAQMASNAENVSIWWRHHDKQYLGASFHEIWRLYTCFYISDISLHCAYVSSHSDSWQIVITTHNDFMIWYGICM